MQYRNDPVAKRDLSILGFGLMRLPHSRPGKTDIATSQKLFEQAVAAGVNYFDTAYSYPGNEEAFGQILENTGLRDSIYIATKLPHGRCKSIEDVERIFTEELARLKTNRIDYYLIHNLPTLEKWERLLAIGIKEWIARKKETGQIGSVGFSFHGAQTDFLALLSAYEWEFAQIQYNYMNEGFQAGRAGLKAIAAKGIPAIIMEPLLGGQLANKLPKNAARMFKEADAQKSYATWGFEWLYDQPEVTVVLSGMNSEEQLSDNIATANRAAAGMLSEDERKLIEQVRIEMEKVYKVPCTGCNYCMPCPSGVNIPGVFSSYNASYLLGYFAGEYQYFSSTASNHAGEYRGVQNCTKCGACEAKCPQKIPIMSSLDQASKRMEPFWFNLAKKLAQHFF